MPDIEEQCKRLKAALDECIAKNKGTSKKGIFYPKLFCISAVTGLGVRELNMTIASEVEKLRAKAVQENIQEQKYDKI